CRQSRRAGSFEFHREGVVAFSRAYTPSPQANDTSKPTRLDLNRSDPFWTDNYDSFMTMLYFRAVEWMTDRTDLLANQLGKVVGLRRVELPTRGLGIEI